MKINLYLLSMNKILKKVLRPPYIKYKKYKNYIESSLYIPNDKFFLRLIKIFDRKCMTFFSINTKIKNQIIQLIKQNFADNIIGLKKRAEDICNHIFDLLGSGRTHLGKHIPWQKDFKSGFSWKPRFYLEVLHRDPLNDPIKLKLKYDGKIPYELSRFQHLAILGKTYWFTCNDKYTEEFINEIEDWIKKNPPKFGINWTMSMEIAIRAANWILGWFFLKDSPLLNEKFKISFFKCLYQHARHIKANLENKGKVTANHYLSDITGLLYLGLFFQNIEKGKYWKKFAISELTYEMEKQVNSDGMHFEGSTCYHRLALELFLFPTLLSVINDASFKGEYVEIANKIFGEKYVFKLYKMFEFLLYTLKPNGMIPQIGDNDNGRLHIFSQKNILDMRYLLNYGAVFFNEPKYKIKEFGLSKDLLWAFGEEGYKKWEKLPENSIYHIKSKAFPNSGIYVMRKKGLFIIISCMHNGQNGNGGHNHNDVFSFELNIDGRDFIIDPGTYNYTGDYKMRNLFRSSFYHNTVVVDNEEINRFKEKEVFKMENEAKPRVLRWETNGNYNLLFAEHYGYMKLHNPIVHRRRFLLDKKNASLNIEDEFEGRGTHSYKIFFHFPDIPLSLNNMILKTNFSEGPNISIKPETKKAVMAELKEGWISPSYGKKMKASYLCYSGRSKVPFYLKTVIQFHNLF